MHHRTATAYKTALCVGAALGGAVSLLFAPTPGSETRRFLRGAIDSARQAASRPAHEAAGVSHDAEYARKLDSLHIKTSKEVQLEMENKLVTMGFITGAIIGGVLGLLYAPRTGKETREFLKIAAARAKEEAAVFAESAKEVAIEKARKAEAAAKAAAEAAAAAIEGEEETEEAKA